MNLWLNCLIVLFLFLVTACGVTTPEIQVAQPTPATSTNAPGVEAATHTPAAAPTQIVAETAVMTPESIAEPTSAATVETAAEVAPTSEIVDWLTVEGKTPDNFTYLGNPDALITIIDYSDFL